MALTNKEKVLEVMKCLETNNTNALEFINPKKYIQHNLSVENGIDGYKKLISELTTNGIKVDVKRTFEDGSYVFCHSEYDLFGSKVGFDIFRMEDGFVVEHWDNLTEKATSLNPSGHSQIDGETEITDREKTEENKALIARFVETILMNNQFDKITDYINPGASNYTQHNPVIADGIEGLGAAFEYMEKQGISMSYHKNHKILGEGNFVLSVSEGEFAGDHVAYNDLLRIKDGKIVEHWGAVQKIPPEAQWKNANGKFGF